MYIEMCNLDMSPNQILPPYPAPYPRLKPLYLQLAESTVSPNRPPTAGSRAAWKKGEMNILGAAVEQVLLFFLFLLSCFCLILF